MAQTDSCLQAYLSEIGQTKILTAQEEVELFKRIEEGDERARGIVVTHNLKFVVRLARKFRGRGLPLEDLIQEGNIGLMEAISKFDYRRGFRFTTYAAFWIRQSIQVAVRQRGSLIRIPARKARQLGYMKEVVLEFRSTLGRAPTETELAERLEITPEKAKELAQIGESVLSLDTPWGPDAVPLKDLLPDASVEPVDQETLKNEIREKVAAALTHLTERESAVIHHRFGFASGVSRSLRKVSVAVGLSQEGVRRVEQRALRKLRRPHLRQVIGGLI